MTESSNNYWRQYDRSVSNKQPLPPPKKNNNRKNCDASTMYFRAGIYPEGGNVIFRFCPPLFLLFTRPFFFSPISPAAVSVEGSAEVTSPRSSCISIQRRRSARTSPRAFGRRRKSSSRSPYSRATINKRFAIAFLKRYLP